MTRYRRRASSIGRVATSAGSYAERVQPFLQARGLVAPNVELAVQAIRDRAQTFVQAADMMDPFFREPPILDEAARPFLTAESVDRLHRLGEALAGVPEWTVPAIEARTVETGFELKTFGQALRVALTGRTASPSLFHVMHVLGRDRTLARLAAIGRSTPTTMTQN